MGTIRQQQRSAKWFWITIGYMCGFAWCVGCMLYQFVGLALGEVSFGIWTVIAIIIAALMLSKSSVRCRITTRRTKRLPASLKPRMRQRKVY